MGLLELPEVMSRTLSLPRRPDILLSAQRGRFDCHVVGRWLILPAGEFGPEDADIIWGVDADSNLIAFDLDDGKSDAVADDDLLAGLPAQYQHVILP